MRGVGRTFGAGGEAGQQPVLGVHEHELEVLSVQPGSQVCELDEVVDPPQVLRDDDVVAG